MFTAVVIPPGGSPLEITPEADSVSFSTLANGGFGSCAFRVPLAQLRGGARRVPKLSDVTLLHGSQRLWEGRIEDQALDFVGGTLGLACFGHQRILEETSVRRIWIQRAIPWQLVTVSPSGLSFRPDTWGWTTIGRFDTADLTRSGIKFSSQTNQAASANDAHGAFYYTEALMKAVLFTIGKVGTDPINYHLYDSADGSTWTSRLNEVVPSSPTAKSVTTISASAKYLQFAIYFGSAVAGANVAAEIENIRILGATTAEDTTGGLYPKTILDDLLALVPDLQVGIIDNDTSFAIESISRAQRDRALSVVQEVTSYYQRRFGVWEDKTFHWRSVNLDEPQWVLDLAELSGCEITSSIDNVAKTIYLEYANAATGLPEEKSATSSDRRNPYVKAGRTKDEVLAAPVGMTSASAQQLVNRLSTDHGSLPAVRGRIKLPAFTLCDNLVGQARPACYIRAGENVVIPELPKEEPLRSGRDGETLFQVTATQTDMERNETQLELEGYARSSDILMARISAATRVLTG